MRTESPRWLSAVPINARSCFTSTTARLNIYSAAPVARSNLQSQELSEEGGGAYFPPSVLHPLSIKVEGNRVYSKGSRGNYPPSLADSSYLLFLLLLTPPLAPPATPLFFKRSLSMQMAAHSSLEVPPLCRSNRAGGMELFPAAHMASTS